MKHTDTHIHAMILRDDVDSDAYVQTAIARGLHEICITDHMPLSCSKAADRIPAGRVREYCAGVRELAEKYADQIRILCGIEIDYHPSVIGEIEAVLGEGDFDLRLGSSHLHVFHDQAWFSSVSCQDYAKMMLENAMAAAESGYFQVIPHIDMYQWVFANPQRFPLRQEPDADDTLAPLIRDTLTSIQKQGIALEINPHFAHAADSLDKVYPGASILQPALDMDLRFCYGSDAHKADHVGILREELLAHPLYGQALRRWQV